MHYSIACRHRGNFVECMLMHRGRQEHLGECSGEMVSRRGAALCELTETPLSGEETGE